MRTVAGMLGGYTKVSVDGDTEYGATESAQFDYAIVVDKSERGRAPPGAAPLELPAQAQAAARLRDLDTHVATAAGTTRSIPQWDENATWDPGD